MSTGRDGTRKFVSDTGWNYGAFALMAGTGVILNFFIVVVMGVEALGVFNQTYAIFVVVGQVATLGIHDSTQKHVAEHGDGEASLRSAIATGAVQAAAFFGFVTALILYLAADGIGAAFESDAVGTSVAFIAPGVGLFAFNKTLIGILNGQRRMREYALAQSLRVLVILLFCISVGVVGGEAAYLGLGFTVAEAVLLPLLLFFVRPRWRQMDAETFAWVARHAKFGFKALTNGILAEAYIRIDVIMLGLFLDDVQVGIYSFAALFVEGLYQVPAVVRTVSNPVLVGLIKAKDMIATVKFTRRVFVASIAIYALAAGTCLLIFPMLAPYFPDGLIVGAYPLLFPLLGGLLLYAGFVPLDYVLLQAGMPGRQSMLMAFNISINIVLNAILIPMFGLWGAAVATGVSFALVTVTLNVASARWLGFRRGLLLTPN